MGYDKEWWRRLYPKADNPSSTNISIEYMLATHGAIGGTPGYADPLPYHYNWDVDRLNAERADRIMRQRAINVGVPVSLVADYGFAKPPGMQEQIDAANFDFENAQSVF